MAKEVYDFRYSENPIKKWLFDNLIVPLFKNQLANRELELLERINRWHDEDRKDRELVRKIWNENLTKMANEYDKQLKEGFGGHD